MKKMIVLDLDDTLLRDDKTISTYTIDTLRRCQKQGILVTFSTARGESNALSFIEAVKPDIVISSGGALARCHDETIYCCAMSRKETTDMLKKARELVGTNCSITVDGLQGHYGNQPPEEDAFQDFTWGNIIYTDFSDFKDQALKISIQITDHNIAKQIAATVPGCSYVPFSVIDWYKFSKPEATKEHAIRVVSRKLDIPLSDMIAFGDDYGDIGMLKLCGTGIAMENAIPEVKKVADDTTASNNEDGVAKYLEQFLYGSFL